MKFEAPVFKKKEKSLLDKMPRLDTLPDDNIAVKYVRDRQIPKDKWKLLYYLDDFTKVENISKSYKDKLVKEPRLIIPFYDERGKLTAIQGRALNDNPLRYVTLKIVEDAPLVFGMDKIDLTSPVNVVEGPLDSLFIPNCVAAGGSDLKRIKHLKDKAILIFDNQPRNKDLIRIMSKSIAEGWHIMFWPQSMEHKDINDMIKASLTSEDICDIIRTTVCQGLRATMRLEEWRRV